MQIFSDARQCLPQLSGLEFVGAYHNELHIILLNECSDAVLVELMLRLLLIVLHELLLAAHFFLLGHLLALTLFKLTRGQQLAEVIEVKNFTILVHDGYSHNVVLRVYLVQDDTHHNAARSVGKCEGIIVRDSFRAAVTS